MSLSLLKSVFSELRTDHPSRKSQFLMSPKEVEVTERNKIGIDGRIIPIRYVKDQLGNRVVSDGKFVTVG